MRGKRLIDIIWIGAIVLILFGLVCSGQDTTPVYLIRGNIFSECFKEPVEVVIFIASNGNFYALTNLMEDSVGIPWDEFVERLNKDSVKIENIICVIHNHVGFFPKFSLRDKKLNTFLREKGFNGWFLLWSSFQQKVTDTIPPKEIK